MLTEGQIETASTSENVLTKETYTTTLMNAPVRKTFEEQQPFIFSIIGFAIAYIVTLIIAQVIKSKLANH